MRVAAILSVAFALVILSGASAAGGPRILFQSLAPSGGDTLFTMAQDGSDVQQLPLSIPGGAGSADWSPDGKRIAFVVQAGDASSIWIADASGKNAKKAVHCAGACLGVDYPSWSPNGQSLAFTYANANPPPVAGPPSGASIRVIDLRSRKVKIVIQSKFPQLVDLARWSPDGQRLVIERDRFSANGNQNGGRIEVVRVSDGQAHPVTAFSAFAFHPDWAKHGNLITFDTYDLLAYRDGAPGASTSTP